MSENTRRTLLWVSRIALAVVAGALSYQAVTGQFDAWDALVACALVVFAVASAAILSRSRDGA